jgi:hypothetical protein
MAHYAELNENNEVIYVAYMDNEIIIDEDGNEIEELGVTHLHTHHGADRRWVRTSYRGNFRNKYASLGDTYREDLDMFISPQPYSSWLLNKTTGLWESPLGPIPELTQEEIDSKSFYVWDEEAYQTDNTTGWFLSYPVE